MIVLADIGNSKIKIARSKDSKLSKVKTFDISKFDDLIKYLNKLDEEYKKILFYSSVIDKKNHIRLSKSFKKIFKTSKRFISTKSLHGITNAYSNFRSLGSDRWVQIVACNKLFKKSDKIIISCGSAISLDYVKVTGKHAGGLILSGAERYSNCFSDIESLKSIKLKLPDKYNLVERNTKQQIISGYVIMVLSVIEKFISQIMKNSKSSPDIIISGSYADFISSQIQYKCSVEKYFVLKSLNWIANRK